MDRQIGIWIDRQLFGLIDRYLDRYIGNGQIDRYWIDRQVFGQIDSYLDRQIGIWINVYTDKVVI